MKGSFRLTKSCSSSPNYILEIKIEGIKPKQRKGGRLYSLVDVVTELDRPVVLDGVPLKPKLILKLFRKLSERDVVRLNRKRCPIKLPEGLLL